MDRFGPSVPAHEPHMSAKTIDAKIVEEEIVTCKSCGQRNRLYKRARHGIYRCRSCRATLPNPFTRHPKSKSSALAILGWLALALIVVVVGVVVIGGSSQPITTSYTAPTTSLPSTSRSDDRPLTYVPSLPTTTTFPRSASATPPPFQQPALPTPPNGEAFTYTDQERIAPFEIKSARGSDYLVKLADSVSGQSVVKVFVRGGSAVNINVPLGTYVVKYASGDTWHGYDYLFGPKTDYSKASEYLTFQHTANRVQGHTITLYKVPYGNLHTERIKPDEF
jgi:ribosomal protein L37AE/L43A